MTSHDLSWPLITSNDLQSKLCLNDLHLHSKMFILFDVVEDVVEMVWWGVQLHLFTPTIVFNIFMITTWLVVQLYFSWSQARMSNPMMCEIFIWWKQWLFSKKYICTNYILTTNTMKYFEKAMKSMSPNQFGFGKRAWERRKPDKGQNLWEVSHTDWQSPKQPKWRVLHVRN